MRKKIEYSSIFICRFIFLLVVFPCFFSCSQVSSVSSGLLSFGTGKNHELKIVSWNVQTFFDSQIDGVEYSQFVDSKSGWGEQMYSLRLERLTSSLIQLDGDIVALQEIENEKIMQDIVNFMFRDCPIKKRYTYTCFAKQPNSPIGCAVLSRIPISNLNVHQVTSWNKDVPSMRPLMQVTFSNCLTSNAQKDLKKTFSLFICHWKSKVGDETESIYWRKKQESVLADKMDEATLLNHVAVGCGDFNKDISEFNCTSDFVILNRGRWSEGNNIKVRNPWLNYKKEAGSYFFRENWEKIDHFFINENGFFSNFGVENSGSWVKEDGKPLAFSIYNGKGYSDHLPISIYIGAK